MAEVPFSATLASATHLGDTNRVSGFWLHPWPWYLVQVSQCMEDFFLSPYLSNKIFLKNGNLYFIFRVSETARWCCNFPVCADNWVSFRMAWEYVKSEHTFLIEALFQNLSLTEKVCAWKYCIACVWICNWTHIFTSPKLEYI